MASPAVNTPGTSTAINEHNVVGDDRSNEVGVNAPESEVNEEGRRSDGVTTIPVGVTTNFPLDDTPLILEKGKENILVIGETGCGKTTFINLAAKVELPVGHALGRCTKTIQSAAFQLQDHSTSVVLYDVPDIDVGQDEPGLRSAKGQVVPVDWSQQPAWTAVIYVIKFAKPRANLFQDENFMILKELEERRRLHKLLFLVSEWPQDTGSCNQKASENLREYEDMYLQTYLSRGAKVHKFNEFKLEELDNDRKLDDLQTDARTAVQALLQSSFTAKEVPKPKDKVQWNCQRLLSLIFKWLRRDKDEQDFNHL